MIASPCFAQNVRKDDIAILAVRQTSGAVFLQPINGAVITVGKGISSCTVTSTPSGSSGSCTPLASLCSSQSDAVCIQTNPTNSDVNGNYGFWVLPGTYQVAISGIGITGKVITYALGCDPTQPCTHTGTMTLSGTFTAGSVGSLTSASANPAQTGVLRLASNVDAIEWRNNLNSNDVGLSKNTSDFLVYGAPAPAGIQAANFYDTTLTSGNCVQATTGGQLVSASGACGTSSGTLTATGSPAANNLAKWSGATSLTNTDLAGDATTSGTSTVTVVKINGNSVPSGAATNQMLVATGASVLGFTTIPNCADTIGQHLNYNNSTQTFTCGSSNITRTGTSSSVCTTGTSAYAQCSTVITWNNSGFADTNYVATCQGTGATQFPYMVGATSQSTTTITVTISNGSGSGAQASTYSSISCIGVHN